MSRMTALAALAATSLLLVPAAAHAQRRDPKPAYEVGVASRTIAVGADGKFDGQPGYLGVGPSVRAIVVGDGKNAMAVADAELQGWFAASKDGAYGISDVRKQVEQRTKGALKATGVIVQSDHSHGGPDLLGVW